MNSHISFSRRSLSALFATTITGVCVRRIQLAIVWSSSVSPTEASTTNSTTSASFTAASTCRLTFASSASPPGIQPPVSTTWNGMSSHSASWSLRSRVMPGRSSTIASWWPTTRLNSVLLPTFGRPMMTTVGRRGGAATSVSSPDRRVSGVGSLAIRVSVSQCSFRALRSEMPSVGTTSTMRGSSSIVIPSRNRPSSDRHTSGSR